MEGRRQKEGDRRRRPQARQDPHQRPDDDPKEAKQEILGLERHLEPRHNALEQIHYRTS